MSFFTRVMGFDEEEYGATQQRLLSAATFSETRGVAGQLKEYCEINGQGGVPVSCGTFSTPSVRELHLEVQHALKDDRVRAAFADRSLVGRSQNGNLTIQNIPGESNSMHSDPNLIFSTVQAASQFNNLEFPNQYVTPEDGISDYEHDHTQGPACAIACAAGTIYRNYLCRSEASPPGLRGQTHDRQFNGLQGVEDILRQKHQVAVTWVVQNGYIESTDQVLTSPTFARVFLDPADRRELVEALRIGVQEDVQVTNVGAGCVRGEAGEMVLDPRLSQQYRVPHQMVTQTYNSAVSIGYSAASSSSWKPLATMVLDATYEATLLVGILNAAKHAVEHGVVPSILLTKVGGGVFQNEQSWIQSAIAQACREITNKYGALPINVKIVHYGQVQQGYEPLEGRSFEAFPPWLLQLHISDEHRALFISEAIDEEAFLLLEDDHLKSLGLKMGPRKRLLAEIRRRQPASPADSHIFLADMQRMRGERSADATPEPMPVTPHQGPPSPSEPKQTTPPGTVVQPSPLASENSPKTPPTATMSENSSVVLNTGGEETVASNPNIEGALVKEKEDDTVTPTEPASGTSSLQGNFVVSKARQVFIRCFPELSSLAGGNSSSPHHLRDSLSLAELLPPVLPRALVFYAMRLILVWILKRSVFAKLQNPLGIIKESKEVDRKALQHTLLFLSQVVAVVGSIFSLRRSKQLDQLEERGARAAKAAREKEDEDDDDENQNTALASRQRSSTQDPSVSTAMFKFTAKEQSLYNQILKESRQVMYLVFGHLAHDLCTIAPDWRNCATDCLHHALAMTVWVGILRTPRELLSISPAIMRMEISTVLLNAMWMLKEATQFCEVGQAKGLVSNSTLKSLASLSLANNLLFSAVFFWLRVLTYPEHYYFKPKRIKPALFDRSPIVFKLSIVQWFLHLYWFSLIARKVIGTVRGK